MKKSTGDLTGIRPVFSESESAFDHRGASGDIPQNGVVRMP